jgi:hypothetical protein
MEIESTINFFYFFNEIMNKIFGLNFRFYYNKYVKFFHFEKWPDIIDRRLYINRISDLNLRWAMIQKAIMNSAYESIPFHLTKIREKELNPKMDRLMKIVRSMNNFLRKQKRCHDTRLIS